MANTSAIDPAEGLQDGFLDQDSWPTLNTTPGIPALLAGDFGGDLGGHFGGDFGGDFGGRFERLRAPAHAGHDSDRMADSIPTACRTVFRRDGGQFSSLIGTLSGMPGTVSAMVRRAGRSLPGRFDASL